PLRHQIRGSILWLVVEGEYDDAALRKAWESALADPAFRDSMSVLIDSRKTAASPSRERVMERAEFLVSLRGRIGPRCAFVGGDALHYGLARMLGAFTEPGGVEIQVFEDVAHAEAWLSSSR